jgi:hypothetical protein
MGGKTCPGGELARGRGGQNVLGVRRSFSPAAGRQAGGGPGRSQAMETAPTGRQKVDDRPAGRWVRNRRVRLETGWACTWGKVDNPCKGP